MPVQRRKLQNPVTGVPAEILSCLQALSETYNLDLYLAADEFVRRCLADIASKLQNATTPAIDYRSTYPNGLRAAANWWAVSSIATSDIHLPADNSRSSPAAPVTAPKHNLGNDLTELIFHTSKLPPQFHDDYLAQLLHLGFYARECDVSSFDATRNALMVAVIQHCATATTMFSWTDNLEAHVEYLRRWMNLNVYRNADLHVLENFVRLQAAALRTKEARDGPFKELARLAFDEEKADCLASLFCISVRKYDVCLLLTASGDGSFSFFGEWGPGEH